MTEKLKSKIDALEPEQREGVYANIRQAVYHLARCWDALRDAESELETEIETDDIECLAGDTVDPSDALELTDDQIREWVMDHEEESE